MRFLYEAAQDVVGQKAITEIAPHMKGISAEIKDRLAVKLKSNGYESFIKLLDVIATNFNMSAPAQAFANDVAKEEQRGRQLALLSANLDREIANAIKMGERDGAQITKAGEGMARAVKSLVEAGISANLAAELIQTRIAVEKWDGHSAVFSPGLPSSNVIIDAGKAAPRATPK